MKIKHLTSINDLSKTQIERIFSRAQLLAEADADDLSQRPDLVFIAKRLGMEVLTMNESTSSRVKGETYLDTLLTLEAMGAKAFIIRTTNDSVCTEMANAMDQLRPHVKIINAGGGTLDHPTQGLLDVFTMLQYFPDLTEKKICIIGDIKHSRVARSTVQVLQKIGATNIHLVAPKNLLPDASEFSGAIQTQNLNDGLKDADVVMTLRIQKERMESSDIPSSDSYHQQFGIDSDKLKLAKEHAIVMHPGPMNRGTEISSELADGKRSVITEQVANGVLIRMALLDLLLS